MKTIYFFCLYAMLCGAMMCKLHIERFEYIAAANRAGTCGTLKCGGGDGAKCKIVGDAPLYSCPTKDCNYCSDEFACIGKVADTTLTGKCLKKTGLGGNCVSSEQCKGGRYEMKCSAKKCVASTKDDRSTNDKCDSGSSCASGACSDGRCAAKALGSPCLRSKACPNNAYCEMTGGCTARNSQKGGACANPEQCKLFTESCMGGRCMEIGVVGKGGPALYDIQCKDGLRSEGGKCVEVDYSKTTACNASYLCEDSRKDCACNTVDPSKPPQCIDSRITCAGAEAAFRECLQKNGCNAESSPQVKGSCADDKCRSSYDAFNACSKNQMRKSLGTVLSEKCVDSLIGTASALSSTIGFLF